MYYFAYGSNLNWPQMQRRCPSAQFVRVGFLADYQFGITRHSRLRDCGTANVFPTPGARVWGVVYDVSDTDLIVMDGFEDGYRREFLSVNPTANGRESVTALVYVAAIESNVPPPNAEYKRVMIAGAKHWQLPPAYIAVLEALQTTQ